MRDIFVGLFMTASGDALPPLQALALFGEFRELTPAGPEGDALVIALADRLVTVDLLDRAAAELERQVEFRLEGAAKARVAARLAEIRLLDKEPTKALAALDGTEMPGLPEEITAARRVLRARALMELNQPDEALAALGADDGQAALRLRVQILRRQQNWPATVLALERLVPAAPPAKRSLTEDESRDVVDLAVALIIAGDRKKMLALGQTYGTAMSRGPHRDTFDLLVGDLDAGRAKTVAEELAQVDTAEAFLASYRKQSVTRPGEAQ